MRWQAKQIEQFDIQGPRYTSYPTALQFHEEFSHEDFLRALEPGNRDNKALSLYVHIPFCRKLCYYCACNKLVTNNPDKPREYLQALQQEIQAVSQYIPNHRPVKYLHLGGGTPTYLSDSELTELMYQLSRYFHFIDEKRADYSIEIDPREINEEKLALLRGLGFSRVSLGIQDFDKDVQQAVNRECSFGHIKRLMFLLSDYDFRSINFDLIYGLPKQSEASFEKTIQKVIELNPDRLSVFNYAHLPFRFKSQGLIREEDLPSPEQKLNMFSNTVKQLLDAGYQYIGMDHFARPYDTLSKAQLEGRLHRNFQGYSLDSDADLIGLGVSAISQIGNVYCQNVDTLKRYNKRLQEGRSALYRGFELSTDDELRRWVISQLMCHKHIDFACFHERFHCQFMDYFQEELHALKELSVQGLVLVDNEQLKLTTLGDHLVRRVCMVFDRYNSVSTKNTNFSRTI